MKGFKIEAEVDPNGNIAIHESFQNMSIYEIIGVLELHKQNMLNRTKTTQDQHIEIHLPPEIEQ